MGGGSGEGRGGEALGGGQDEGSACRVGKKRIRVYIGKY